MNAPQSQPPSSSTPPSSAPTRTSTPIPVAWSGTSPCWNKPESTSSSLPPLPRSTHRGFNTWVDVLGPAQGTEGLYRPGHFRGVATVVAKLLNITRPDRAYFGQKDGNQTAVIRQLARDLDMMTEIVIVPTVREESGLAYSSRNAYLDSYQRAAADVIYRALTHASALYASGQRHAATIAGEVRDMINSEPLVNGIDYVSITDAQSMNDVEWLEHPAMLAVAVHIGGTRLIDNVILGGE